MCFSDGMFNYHLKIAEDIFEIIKNPFDLVFTNNNDNIQSFAVLKQEISVLPNIQVSLTEQ